MAATRAAISSTWLGVQYFAIASRLLLRISFHWKSGPALAAVVFTVSLAVRTCTRANTWFVNEANCCSSCRALLARAVVASAYCFNALSRSLCLSACYSSAEYQASLSDGQIAAAWRAGFC